MLFGEYLVSKKLISNYQLEAGLSTQHFLKRPLGRTLRDLGHLSQEQLNQALSDFVASQCRWNLSELGQKIESLRSFSGLMSWSQKREMLPVFKNSEKVIFISPTFRDEVLERAEQILLVPAHLLLIDSKRFEHLRSNVLGLKSSNQKELQLSQLISEDDKLKVQDPYREILRECLRTARNRGASDIHIEPKENQILIRHRIYGELSTWKTLEENHREPFINCVKDVINLDLSVSGKPQDARASLNSLDLDLRVNSLPTLYGEKIVLRLLDQKKQFSIEKMGFDVETTQALRYAVRAENGLVVLSGPTGSGKTTTLYSLLASLDSEKLNITTLEDPIEYRLSGINQTQVSARLSFQEGLRSLMRQDPDVILVGEIRDQETAELCFKAAATGHLVISTIHANGAAEVIERLKGLGIDDLSISSNLRFSSAQRLVKKLCQDCALPGPSSTKNRNPSGCKNCSAGISGRSPLMETLTANEIQDFLQSGQLSKGSKSLKDKVADFVSQGLADSQEYGHEKSSNGVAHVA